MRVLHLPPIVVLLASVAASPQSSAVQQKARPADKRAAAAAVIRRPAWIAWDDIDDGQNLLLVGAAANAGSQPDAQRLASASAIDKAVARVAERLFADPSTTTFYGIEALRQYVRKVSRVRETWSAAAPDNSYEACVLVQISNPFLQPAWLRQYAAAPAPPDGSALGYVVIPAKVGATSVTRRTQVRMARLRDGNFYFFFNVLQGKNAIAVKLDQIQVIDDGSSGKTSWTFDITIAGRPMLKIPVADYTDDVVTYRRADKPYEYALSPGERVVEIKVTGSRASAQRLSN